MHLIYWDEEYALNASANVLELIWIGGRSGDAATFVDLFDLH
jgi:hypothetical protein